MDWKALKAEYIRGGISYRGLCAKYGVSYTTLSRTAKREKWIDLRNQAEAKGNSKVIDSISSEYAKRNSKIDKTADKLLDKIADLIENTEVIDPKGISHLASAIKAIKEIKGTKTDLDLKEQKARIAKLEKDLQSEAQSNDIVVTFTANMEEYSN